MTGLVPRRNTRRRFAHSFVMDASECDGLISAWVKRVSPTAADDFRSTPISRQFQSPSALRIRANFGSERSHSIASSARGCQRRWNGEPDFPDTRVTYLDATEHPGTVQEYKIMSTPESLTPVNWLILGASATLSNQTGHDA